MGAIRNPHASMQVPISEQVLQPGVGQPQTAQAPGFLKQFPQGMNGVANPRSQFDAAMFVRGGNPWQFASGAMWAPNTTNNIAQGFQQGTMMPQAMPQLNDQQMQAILQMIVRNMRF